MAYDEDLADRLRAATQEIDGVREQAMFGGLAFLVGGHMAVAASGKGGLMLRCAPGDSEALVAEAGVDRMVMRGKEMDGWLRVSDAAIEDEGDLQRWVAVGVAYASSLPPK